MSSPPLPMITPGLADLIVTSHLLSFLSITTEATAASFNFLAKNLRILMSLFKYLA